MACVPDLESGATGDPWALPDNRWPASEPPPTLHGEGFHEGQVIPDFRLVDQFGDEVALWQFHGHVVVVDISTVWCRPCQVLAEDTEHTWQEYRDEGVVYVTVLAENIDGDDPTVDDLAAWADAFGITAPVVADPGRAWSDPAVPGNQYPYLSVVGTDAVVEAVVDPPTDANLRAAIDDVLALESL